MPRMVGRIEQMGITSIKGGVPFFFSFWGGLGLAVVFISYLFIYLAVLGLRCCVWAFSSCGEQGLLFVAVRGLLIVVASLVAEHGL